VTTGGTAPSADLGGSSGYSSYKRLLEGRSWGRVPCQRHTDMGQPILSHGGNLLTKYGFILAQTRRDGRPFNASLEALSSQPTWESLNRTCAIPVSKGNQVNIPGPKRGWSLISGS